MNRVALFFGIFGLLWLIFGYAAPLGRDPDPVPEKSREFAGLHNFFELPLGRTSLMSGSAPESEESFAGLKSLGIKIIISVDGARPDVETARRYGMQYIHIPIGYDGISPERATQIAKAAQWKMGNIYVHCHHGKHRGPAAVAVIMKSQKPFWSAEKAKQWMKVAGTDPKYTGLYKVRHVTQFELDECPNNFPEIATVPDLARLMVEIDTRWEHLKAIREARWETPHDHPDLVPHQEAVLLAEAYREAARLKASIDRGPEFLAMLKQAETDAHDLAAAIKTKSEPTMVFARSQKMCSTCHIAFRDNPGK